MKAFYGVEEHYHVERILLEKIDANLKDEG